MATPSGVRGVSIPEPEPITKDGRVPFLQRAAPTLKTAFNIKCADTSILPKKQGPHRKLEDLQYLSIQPLRSSPPQVDFKRYTLTLDAENPKRSTVRASGTLSYLNRRAEHAKDESRLDFLNDPAITTLMRNSDGEQVTGHIFSTNTLGRFSEPDQHHVNISLRRWYEGPRKVDVYHKVHPLRLKDASDSVELVCSDDRYRGRPSKVSFCPASGKAATVWTSDFRGRSAAAGTINIVRIELHTF